MTMPISLIFILVLVALVFGIGKFSKASRAGTLLLDLLGVLSLPIIVAVLQFAMVPNTGNGSGAAWLLILTGSTGGIFAIIALLAFAFAGRLALRLGRAVFSI